MIGGTKYIDSVKEYFNFLITQFSFEILEEKIRGNAFYDMQYTDTTKVISISYENIEDYLLVIVSILQNGELPDYDDKTKTLDLKQLNVSIFPTISRSEITENHQFFTNLVPKNELEKKLLKYAEELRLCLNHLNL